MAFTCCNDQQWLSIVLIVLYAVLILKLWRIQIIHPFKILTVFLHELGHAVACWLTCGKVQGMEVHPNEGGVTKTSGGVQWIILMAGYLGSALWGMGLIVASASYDGTHVAAIVLVFFLAMFIFFGSNSYLRILNAGFIVFLAGLFLIDIYTKYNPLQYATLFMGVMSCLFSIYDIWDDLLARRTNESDASMLAKLTKTSSRCWGIIWGLFAVVALVLAVFLHLLIAKRKGGPLKLSETSTSTKVVFGCTVAVVFVSLLHTAITKRVMIRKRNFGSKERNDGSYVCVEEAA